QAYDPSSQENNEMTTEERRKRAIEWLETVYQDYAIAVLDHYIFWEVNKMFDNPKLKPLDGTFQQWMLRVYTNSVALAIRRQAESGRYSSGGRKDIISLRSLLEELRDYPDL